jgi:hypothetical protein
MLPTIITIMKETHLVQLQIGIEQIEIGTFKGKEKLDKINHITNKFQSIILIEL